MSTDTTQMRAEILEIPDAVERLLTEGNAAIVAAADKARAAKPRFLLSVARGSSGRGLSPGASVENNSSPHRKWSFRPDSLGNQL